MQFVYVYSVFSKYMFGAVVFFISPLGEEPTGREISFEPISFIILDRYQRESGGGANILHTFKTRFAKMKNRKYDYLSC